jgi:hypothetical protein
LPYGEGGVPSVNDKDIRDPHNVGLILASFILIAENGDLTKAVRTLTQNHPDVVLESVYKLVQGDKDGTLMERFARGLKGEIV